MADPSVFRGIIEFFGKIGVYDVLLPFLLVFTIVFAVLERSKVFGTEKIKTASGEYEYPKKNLNAMVAFCSAFFVVASTQLVSIVNEAFAKVMLLVLLLFCILLLVATLMGEKYEEGMKSMNTWLILGSVIGVLLIFAGSIKTASGSTWLEVAWKYVVQNWSGDVVGTIILLAVIIGFMYYVVAEPKQQQKSDSG